MTRQVRARMAGQWWPRPCVLPEWSTRRPRRRREKKSSYAPVDIKEDFAAVMARMKAAKAGVDEAPDGPARRALRPRATAPARA